MKLYAHKLLKKLQPSPTQFLILLSVVVGSATAFGAIGFIALIKYFNSLFFEQGDAILTHTVGFSRIGGYKWYLPLIPALGGLMVGPLVYRFAKEAKGHGVPEVMNSVARLGGIIRPRVAAVKTVASAICIGSGGSAGREGPIIQIGSAIGSTIGQWFHLTGGRVKILVGCGAAAGISAVFNAPIAGVFFSLEIILGDYAIKTFSPVIIASVVASVITRTFMGDHPAFEVPDYSLVSAWEIPLYIAMGSIIGGIGVGFTRGLDEIEDLFDKLKMVDWAKPAIGGLLMGGIAIFYPQVLADGYETIRLTLMGNMGLALMVILIGIKMVATCLTLGSGNSGGIFAPALFMGAVAGGAFGYIVHLAFPGVTATPGAYALVGMAAMVAGTTHAPMTAMLIIFEMTSDYRIILPLMVAVVFSALVAGRLFPYSIYTIKLFKRGIDIRQGKDINVLRSHTVAEVIDTEFDVIPASMNLHDIFRHIETSKESYYVVNDKSGNLKGVISLQAIRNLLSQHALDYLVIAQDMVPPETVVIMKTDSLEQAHKVFGQHDFKLLPVVTHDNPHKVIGVIRKESLIDSYNRWLLETLRR